MLTPGINNATLEACAAENVNYKNFCSKQQIVVDTDAK